MKISVRGPAKSRYKEPKELSQGAHFNNWLRNMVPNFDQDKLVVHGKGKGWTHTVTLIIDDKLVNKEFSPYTDNLRPLIPIFVDYFDGKGWTKFGFSKIQGSVTHPQFNGVVIRGNSVPNKHDYFSYGISSADIDRVRQIVPDCGFAQAGPDGAIPIEQFLQQNGQP